MARQFATRETGRVARIASQRNPYFHNVPTIRVNRIKTAIRTFLAPRSAIHKKKRFSSGTLFFQKTPRVRKICVRNSGAGNGRANCMGAWKNAFFLQEKTHVPKIPPFRGGVFWVLGVPILFLWARGFF